MPLPSSALDGPHGAQLRNRTDPLRRPGSPPASVGSGSPEPAQPPGEDDSRPDRKTFGRTPAGQVFTVPQTHDMVSQLLSPSQPKNLSDVVVIAILLGHIGCFYYVPSSCRSAVLGLVFLFWRLAYNAGIGYLLNIQSNGRQLVGWAKKTGIFEPPESGKNAFPRWHHLLKHEMEVKIRAGYSFDRAPVEYNTWLLFRRLVDLILMCDFTSYVLFALSCFGQPAEETVLLRLARWAVGIGLILFNLWVKLDAHRVVKDYAWYWGDFFFLIDQELTFDGVFEMAPHPMYSVGYAGYYGISLLAASYKVLFISVLAHAAQFAFLILVENPHIEKTYNPDGQAAGMFDLGYPDHAPADRTRPARVLAKPSALDKLIGIKNIDLHRPAHLCAAILLGYTTLWSLTTAPTGPVQALFVLNALGWRLWYSVGIGYLLSKQSTEKRWTRHFIKYGETVEDAWRQWKSVYYISMVACNCSFVAAAYKTYALPSDWNYGLVMLRHILGSALIGLQVWTVASMYDSLGEFGWFFGDFFFDESPRLAYEGIYRFLNNPERVLGLAGAWGFALITWHPAIFFLALISHILTLSFIELVEQPHMQRLYGQSLRQDSGLSKSLKKSLPGLVQVWQNRVDQILSDARDSLEDFIRARAPLLKDGVDKLVRDSSTRLRSYPAQIKISVQSFAAADLPPSEHYSLDLLPPTPAGGAGAGAAAKEAAPDGIPVLLAYGAPVRVRWTAPRHHRHRHDWIGFYRVSDGSSRLVTHVSSKGRWIATSPDAYGNETAAVGLLSHDQPAGLADADADADGQLQLVQGEVEFFGEKLWWVPGFYELRYHHGEHHNVMAISAPLEIRLSRFEDKGFRKRADRRRVIRRSATATPVSNTPPQSATPDLLTPTIERITRSRQGSLLNDELVARLTDSYDDCDSDYEASTNQTRMLIENSLLPIVQNCLDRDPRFAPNTVTDLFVKPHHPRPDSEPADAKSESQQSASELVAPAPGLTGPGHVTLEHAARITYAVNQMFGIEFDPIVVAADGSVRRLATRICVAKRVLEKTGITDGASIM